MLGGFCVGAEGKTISIEANPWIFDYLMKGILYSGYLERTKAFNCAVGPVTGEELSVMFAPEWAGGGFVRFNDPHESAGIPLTDETLNACKWPDTLNGHNNQGPGRM